MTPEQAEALMVKGDSLYHMKAYKCYKEVADSSYAVGKFKEAVCLLEGIFVIQEEEFDINPDYALEKTQGKSNVLE